MSGFYIPENQSVCWSVYNQAIANECHLPDSFLATQAKRINRAFDSGEPIWMIIDELKIVYQCTHYSDGKPILEEKTPLQLAKSIVRF